MSANLNEAPDTAGVVAPPPLIYAGALAAGLLLSLSSLRTMRQAGADVRPDKPRAASSLKARTVSRATRSTWASRCSTVGSPPSPTRYRPPCCSPSSSL